MAGRKIRHNHSKPASPTYRSWRSMICRCRYPYFKSYAMYGGAGITVCDRWLAFDNFLEDMGERPEGTSIDRIDGTKGYFKENCRWADRRTQRLNQKPRMYAKFFGELRPVVDLVKEYSVKPATLRSWVRKGLDVGPLLKERQGVMV